MPRKKIPTGALSESIATISQDDKVWAKGQLASSTQNIYLDYYYSGQDIYSYVVGAEETKLPLEGLAFNIEQKKAPIYGAHSYCVDETTEALTKRGWVNGFDLSEDDIILSMDPFSQELKWSTIRSIYRNFDYNDKMFKITSKNIDALVTPGHKFALADGTLKPVDEIRKKDRIVSMGLPVKQADSIYSDKFVELVGWFVTEGHLPKSSKAVILCQSQKVNPLYCKRIENCLDSLGVTYKTYLQKTNECMQYYIHASNRLVDELVQVAPNRVLSFEFISSLSDGQRLLLMNTMIDGDGWRSGKNARQYIQKDKNHLDAFVALCAMCGIATQIGQRKDGCYTVTLKNRRINEGYSLDFNGGYVSGRYNTQINKKNPKKHTPTEAYSGLVWCPETDYGTFVCRRNDKVYVTGNTYDAVMRGTRIISGSFVITTMRQDFMIDVLTASAQAKLSRYQSMNPTGGSSQYSISEGGFQSTDYENIRRYWDINPEKSRDMANQTEGKHIFSSHPPFDLAIVYGLQMLSINDEYAQGRSFGLVGDYASDNALHMDTNERLVDGGDFNDSKHRVMLKDIELLSCQMNYAPDGSQLNEVYTFFARDYTISRVW